MLIERYFSTFLHKSIYCGVSNRFASLKMRRKCCDYRNDPKFSDIYAWANSADPDQTAPRGAV